MLYSVRENLGGTRHLLRKLSRIALGRSALWHYEGLRKRYDDLELVLDVAGEPICCKKCGYAQIRIKLPGGWELETCSAVAHDSKLDMKRLTTWASTLPEETASTTTLDSSEKQPAQ